MHITCVNVYFNMCLNLRMVNTMVAHLVNSAWKSTGKVVVCGLVTCCPAVGSVCSVASHLCLCHSCQFRLLTFNSVTQSVSLSFYFRVNKTRFLKIHHVTPHWNWLNWFCYSRSPFDWITDFYRTVPEGKHSNFCKHISLLSIIFTGCNFVGAVWQLILRGGARLCVAD